MDIRVEIDTRALVHVKALGGDLPKVMRRGIERILMKAAEGVQETARRKPVMRSGRLVGAWTPKRGSGDKATELRTKKTRTGAYGLLGPRKLAYARIHEEGGTVTPKHSKYLAIPLGPAKTKAGVARKKSPRDWPNTFFVKTKKGTMLIGQKTEGRLRWSKAGRSGGRVGTRGKGGVRWLYVLKESVKIPATHYVERGVKKYKRRYSKIMDQTLYEEIRNRRMDVQEWSQVAN